MLLPGSVTQPQPTHIFDDGTGNYLPQQPQVDSLGRTMVATTFNRNIEAVVGLLQADPDNATLELNTFLTTLFSDPTKTDIEIKGVTILIPGPAAAQFFICYSFRVI